MEKIALWCRDLDGLIGVANDLPWHLPEDFKVFKRVTLGNTLIMGQKSYESLPNRTLPKRDLIVLTQKSDYQVSNSEKHITAVYKDNKIQLNPNGPKDLQNEFEILDELYITGGAFIYNLLFDETDYVIETIYGKHHPQYKENGIFLNLDMQKKLENEFVGQTIAQKDDLTFVFWKRQKSPSDPRLEKKLINKIKGVPNE